MGIDRDDIKRAILGGGDISAFSQVYLQALNNPPVGSLPLFDQSLPLPDPMVFAKLFNRELVRSISSRENEGYSLQTIREKGNLTLIALTPYGKDLGKYLEQIIDEVKPDIIAIDSRPPQLSANMLYTFSLTSALGLPALAEIIYKDTGQQYDNVAFYPGNMNETVLIKSWLNKIPLLPIGPPEKPVQPGIYSGHGYLYDAYFWAQWQSDLSQAYRALDDNLSHMTGIGENDKMAENISAELMESLNNDIDGSLRQLIMEESRYLTSRMSDIAAFARLQGRKSRILALIDVVHYSDVLYILKLSERGTAERYIPTGDLSNISDMRLVGRKNDKLGENDKSNISQSTLAQELFHSQFRQFIRNKEAEILPENEVNGMITEITGRLRSHPDIARGLSVRGTLAFKEVLCGFALQMKGGLTREAIRKAALTTLTPRISLKLKGSEEALVNETVEEVLYNFRFSKVRISPAQGEAGGPLSTDEILDSLDKLGPIPAEQNRELNYEKRPVVFSDVNSQKARLSELQSMGFLEKDRQGRYAFTRKALEYMLNELEQKLAAGEITEGEYDSQKARLTTLLKNLSKPQFSMSTQEKATTIMEIMDAQDKGWNSGVNFDIMHLYYHVKANSEGAELSPQKRDYYALGRLIDDLEKQQILKTAKKESGFVLTGIALDMLYNYLMEGDRKGRRVESVTGFGRTLSNERKHEIRRYSSGNAFHDISVRHTLREISRQKKSLSEVRNNDFRVFLKQAHKHQSDIVICIDTSGSMGFHHELTYARLVAAGLVQAAITNGDRVGIVAFNDYGQVTIPLTDKYGDSLIDCIAGLSVKGNTNIGDGLKCASGLLFQDRMNNQKYIVLITDGQPTAISEKVFARLRAIQGKDLTEESAILETRMAAAGGARVSVIHIAGQGQASSKFIRNIAAVGKGKIRRISCAEDIKAVLR